MQKTGLTLTIRLCKDCAQLLPAMLSQISAIRVKQTLVMEAFQDAGKCYSILKNGYNALIIMQLGSDKDANPILYMRC